MWISYVEQLVLFVQVDGSSKWHNLHWIQIVKSQYTVTSRLSFPNNV
jgi:hypothetical protein